MAAPPEKTWLESPWFSVREKLPRSGGHGHYVIDCPDFVVILALDSQGNLLLVRQFRPAIAAETLELPAGLVDPGQTPEQTARKELLEETGYVATTMEQIAVLSPSPARFRNRMWCFFSPDAHPCANPDQVRERGMRLVLYHRGWRALLDEPQFIAGSSCATLFAALSRGKIAL